MKETNSKKVLNMADSNTFDNFIAEMLQSGSLTHEELAFFEQDNFEEISADIASVSNMLLEVCFKAVKENGYSLRECSILIIELWTTTVNMLYKTEKSQENPLDFEGAVKVINALDEALDAIVQTFYTESFENDEDDNDRDFEYDLFNKDFLIEKTEALAALAAQKHTPRESKSDITKFTHSIVMYISEMLDLLHKKNPNPIILIDICMLFYALFMNQLREEDPKTANNLIMKYCGDIIDELKNVAGDVIEVNLAEDFEFVDNEDDEEESEICTTHGCGHHHH